MKMGNELLVPHTLISALATVLALIWGGSSWGLGIAAGGLFSGISLWTTGQYVERLLGTQKKVAWPGVAIVIKYPLFGAVSWLLLANGVVNAAALGLGVSIVVMTGLAAAVKKRLFSKTCF